MHRRQASFSGSGVPAAVTPEFIGQIYYDELTEDVYVSKSLVTGDWKLLGVSLVETEIEQRTITAGEEAAKSLTLAHTPIGGVVSMNVISGTAQEQGVDFDVAADVLSWNLLGLDGVLVQNNVVVLIYRY